MHLYSQLFLQSGIDIFEMANQVVSQNYIGSVLHVRFSHQFDMHQTVMIF